MDKEKTTRGRIKRITRVDKVKNMGRGGLRVGSSKGGRGRSSKQVEGKGSGVTN